jgi:hypothetical protein
MIKLMELLNHILNNENEEGLTEVDNWKATDAMYLEDIGFKNDGIYHYALKKPEMKISHKKGEGFIVEDSDHKSKHTFPTFKELEEFFANYKQQWKNAPYL